MNSRSRRERFLLDCDVEVDVENLLATLGFKVEIAEASSVDIHDDVAILRHARKHRRILLCHDRHRDMATRWALYEEIALRGGQIICVSRGGRGHVQTPLEVVGILLAHSSEWRRFFDEKRHGRVLLHRSGCGTRDQQQLMKEGPSMLGVDVPVVPGSARPQRRRVRPIAPDRSTRPLL